MIQLVDELIKRGASSVTVRVGSVEVTASGIPHAVPAPREVVVSAAISEAKRRAADDIDRVLFPPEPEAS